MLGKRGHGEEFPSASWLPWQISGAWDVEGCGDNASACLWHREELGQEQHLLFWCSWTWWRCGCLLRAFFASFCKLWVPSESRLARLQVQPSRTIPVYQYYLPRGRFLHTLINYFQIPWLNKLQNNIFRKRDYIIKCQKLISQAFKNTSKLNILNFWSCSFTYWDILVILSLLDNSKIMTPFKRHCDWQDYS